MTKDIKQMTDSELNRACALAVGWSVFQCEVGVVFPDGSNTGYTETGTGRNISKKQYQPTANTEAGKSQCFDLMVKFGIGVARLKAENYWLVEYPSSSDFNYLRVPAKNPELIQRAICQAVALLEEEG